MLGSGCARLPFPLAISGFTHRTSRSCSPASPVTSLLIRTFRAQHRHVYRHAMLEVLAGCVHLYGKRARSILKQCILGHPSQSLAAHHQQKAEKANDHRIAFAHQQYSYAKREQHLNFDSQTAAPAYGSRRSDRHLHGCSMTHARTHGGWRKRTAQSRG